MSLKIKVQLFTGEIQYFTQSDPEKIKGILDSIHPTKFFKQPSLVAHSNGNAFVFPIEGILRVDLQSDNLPAWPFPHGILSIREENSLEPVKGITIEIRLANGEMVRTVLTPDPMLSPEEVRESFDPSKMLQLRSNQPFVYLTSKGLSLISPLHIVMIQITGSNLPWPESSWEVDSASF